MSSINNKNSLTKRHCITNLIGDHTSIASISSEHKL
jgi:hypothetical protein